MAEAIKCDKCGEFVLKEDSVKIGIGLTEKTMSFMSMRETILIAEKVIDVCISCKEKVEERTEDFPVKLESVTVKVGGKDILNASIGQIKTDDKPLSIETGYPNPPADWCKGCRGSSGRELKSKGSHQHETEIPD